jgi:DNA polymerase I-like protein with 3'-5' exonuclease and polymerase domains
MFINLGDGKITRQMVKYASRDVPLLFPVMRGQLKEFTQHELNFVAQLEFDNIPVAVEMEAGGFYLDQSKLKLLIVYWEQRQAAMEKQILELYSKRMKGDRKVSILPEEWWREVFRLKSNKDKLEAVNRILEVPIHDVKRATMLAANDDVTKLLAEYSNVLKNTSTYGDNMLKKINEKTGLCYPRFAQMGSGGASGDGRDNKETTATGRWVGDAQQYPRKSDGRYSGPLSPKEDAAVRSYFAGTIEGIKAKYSQGEKAA